jgi:hypothetical protein
MRGPAQSPFFFFRRCVQRFFMASDSRFLPAAVIPPRLFLGRLTPEAAPFGAVIARLVPSSAAMARLSRSLSLSRSETIFRKSKIPSIHSPGRVQGQHPQ